MQSNHIIFCKAVKHVFMVKLKGGSECNFSCTASDCLKTNGKLWCYFVKTDTAELAVIQVWPEFISYFFIFGWWHWGKKVAFQKKGEKKHKVNDRAIESLMHVLKKKKKHADQSLICWGQKESVLLYLNI